MSTALEFYRIFFKIVGAVAFTAAIVHIGGWWWSLLVWGLIVWLPDQWFFRK